MACAQVESYRSREREHGVKTREESVTILTWSDQDDLIITKVVHLDTCDFLLGIGTFSETMLGFVVIVR